ELEDAQRLRREQILAREEDALRALIHHALHRRKQERARIEHFDPLRRQVEPRGLATGAKTLEPAQRARASAADRDEPQPGVPLPNQVFGYRTAFRDMIPADNMKTAGALKPVEQHDRRVPDL